MNSLEKTFSNKGSNSNLKWLLMLVLLGFAFHYRIILSGSGKILFGPDFIFQYYGFKGLIVSEFKAGSVPLWNPYQFAGMPLLAVSWSGALYPPDVIFLIFSVFTALKISIVLHTILMVIGMFMLAREMDVSEQGSFLSAVAYAFCAHFFWQVGSGHISENIAAAWLPFMFFAYLRYVKNGQVRWVVIGGGCLALAILGGNYQYIYYGMVVFGFWVLVKALMERDRGLKAFTLKMAGAIGIGIVAIGLSAAQILPVMELLGQSSRSVMSKQIVGILSFMPNQFSAFLFPLTVKVQYEQIGYFGLIPLGLVALGVGSRRRIGKTLPLIVPGVVIILMMLGNNSPIFDLLYRFFPGYKIFRIHASAVPLLVMVLCPIAGMGLDSLISRDSITCDKARRTAVYVFIILSLEIAILWSFAWIQSFKIRGVSGFFDALKVFEFGHDWRIILPVVLPVLALIVMILWRKLKVATAVTILMALIIADLFLISPPLVDNPWAMKRKQDYNDMAVDMTALLSRDPIPRNDYRVAASSEYFSPIISMDLRVSNVNGYCSMNLLRFRRFIHTVTGIYDNPQFSHPYSDEMFKLPEVLRMRLFNVKYYLIRSTGGKVPVIIVDETFLPRAFWINNWRIAPDEESAFQAVIDPDFDPAELAILEREPGFSSSNEATELVPARIIRYKPRLIELGYSAPGDGILVLDELFYPGWKAYLDGIEVPVFKVDYLLRGIRAPGGDHTVRFAYLPASFYFGALISLVFLIGCVCVLTGKQIIVFIRNWDIIQKIVKGR